MPMAYMNNSKGNIHTLVKFFFIIPKNKNTQKWLLNASYKVKLEIYHSKVKSQLFNVTKFNMLKMIRYSKAFLD